MSVERKSVEKSEYQHWSKNPNYLGFVAEPSEYPSAKIGSIIENRDYKCVNIKEKLDSALKKKNK